jgi:hypothetical protein
VRLEGMWMVQPPCSRAWDGGPKMGEGEMEGQEKAVWEVSFVARALDQFTCDFFLCFPPSFFSLLISNFLSTHITKRCACVESLLSVFKHRDNNKTQRKHGDGDGGGESGGTRLESNSPS